MTSIVGIPSFSNLAAARPATVEQLPQPAFPTIYPPDPEIVGHALLINKDFVEMMALLVIVTVPAGRWGGLDFFLRRMFRRRFGLKPVSHG